MKQMFRITFQYRDFYSGYQWRTQSCVVSSLDECIRIYGLGVDCDYRIISMVSVDSPEDGE